MSCGDVPNVQSVRQIGFKVSIPRKIPHTRTIEMELALRQHVSVFESRLAHHCHEILCVLVGTGINFAVRSWPSGSKDRKMEGRYDAVTNVEPLAFISQLRCASLMSILTITSALRP